MGRPVFPGKHKPVLLEHGPEGFSPVRGDQPPATTDRMWTVAWLTFRQGLRQPATALLVALGLLAALAGQGLSVLALGGGPTSPWPLLADTACSFAVLAGALLLVRLGEADLGSGIAWAARQTTVGELGWTVGRVLGSVLLGAAILALAVVAEGASEPSLAWLLLTTTCVLPLSLSWVLLLHRSTGSSTLALVGGLALYVLGRLPWGSPEFAAGPGWSALGALLPRAAPEWRTLPSAALATLGLTCVALAWSAPRRNPA